MIRWVPVVHGYHATATVLGLPWLIDLRDVSAGEHAPLRVRWTARFGFRYVEGYASSWDAAKGDVVLAIGGAS